MEIEKTRDKVKALEIRLKQAKALVLKQEAIANNKELLKAGEESRKDETRKKILIGAYILTTIEDPLTLGQEGKLSFKAWLMKARDDERALFGLQAAPPAGVEHPGEQAVMCQQTLET